MRKWIVAIAGVGLVAVMATAIPASAGRWGHHHIESAEEMREVMDHVASRLYRKVDATDAQRQAIDAILDKTVPKAWAQREARGDFKQRIAKTLGAEVVSPDAVEGLRQEGLQRLDAGSTLLTETLLQVAEVLTPEQRGELIALAERFHH